MMATAVPTPASAAAAIVSADDAGNTAATLCRSTAPPMAAALTASAAGLSLRGVKRRAPRAIATEAPTNARSKSSCGPIPGPPPGSAGFAYSSDIHARINE